jgi:hypothetical protein
MAEFPEVVPTAPPGTSNKQPASTEFVAQAIAGQGTAVPNPGTTGGVPFYNTPTSLAASAALTGKQLVVGGDAGGPAPLGSAGTTGQVLSSQGPGVLPIWSSAGGMGPPGPAGPTGPGYIATSTSTVTIGTGAQTFTTQAGLAYAAGTRVRVASSATPSSWMEGLITSYSGTTMAVNVDLVSGSGSFSSWNINVAGTQGAGNPGGSPNSLQYNNAGSFGGLGPLTNGQLLIGSTGAAAVPAVLTPGANVTITNAPGAITIASTGGGGTVAPADAFVATLSADQTGIAASTFTKVNFNTPGFNQNGKFNTATSRWTPAAGPVQIEAQVTTNNAGTTYAAIYKNGVNFKQMGIAGATQSRVTVTDNANGTDYYEVWTLLSVAGSVLSAANNTFFQGFAIAPQGGTGPQGPQGLPGPTTPADAFTATLSADQAGVAVNTPVKVNFNTAGYNQNGKFSTSTSRWTPAAGPVQIEAQINFGTSAIGQYIIIYKNGVQFKYLGSSNANVFGAAISVVDTANGTDYYECWAQSSVANTILSNPVVTFFQGFAIAPQGPVGPQGPQGTPGPTTPADAFVATLSADQTGIAANSLTKVNFNTSTFNQNNKFFTSGANAGRWIPSAGPVQIEAQIQFTNTASSHVGVVLIYKNGVSFKQESQYGSGTFVYAPISVVDTANGTDYYECWVSSNVADGVAGTANTTFFQGFAIAPQGPAGLQGPQGPAGLGANPADAFVATLSADQTGIAANTNTKINFNVANYNQNGKFFTTGGNAGRWIPTAGPVQIEAQLLFGAVATNVYVSIYKNGTQLKFQGTGQDSAVAISVVDTASGTDYYECWAQTTTAGSVSSVPTATFFQGFAISPQGPAGQNGATGSIGPPSVSAPAKIQLFTTSGTYTPSANLVSAVVEVIGGGGGGGGSLGAAQALSSGGGGGSGAYARRALTAAQIGASQSVTIGAAGVGAANTNGTTGGDTLFGSLAVAKGGLGGGTCNSSAVGYGGQGGPVSGSVGDIVFAGAAGVSGTFNGVTTAGTTGGSGGSSAYGGGASTANPSLSAVGLAASNYGSGGSGSSGIDTTARAGGNGSPGVVIVTEYIGIAASPAIGSVVNTAYAELTTWTTTTLAMAGALDTIPQQTDGAQLLTVTITPKSVTDKLRIHFSCMAACSSNAGYAWVALFQDNAAAALTATAAQFTSGGFPQAFALDIDASAGTTSATTFKVRFGNNAGSSQTIAVNGSNTGRQLGGSSRAVLQITEIAA